VANYKAIYWLAIGAMALGLNSAYQQGEFRWAHRMADRLVLAADHDAQRGLSLLSVAEVMAGRNPTQVIRLQAALAGLEARASLPQAQSEELAHAQQELLDLKLRMGDLQSLKAQCPHVRVGRERRDAMVRQVRNQVASATDPRFEDQNAIFVNAIPPDPQSLEALRKMALQRGQEARRSLESLRNVESLQNIESLRNKESLKAMKSMQKMEMFNTMQMLNSMDNFKIVVPAGPQQQMRFEFHMQQKSDGDLI